MHILMMSQVTESLLYAIIHYCAAQLFRYPKAIVNALLLLGIDVYLTCHVIWIGIITRSHQTHGGVLYNYVALCMTHK